MRQARLGLVPDPVEAALAAERAGADSIVCHLREDRRHIQDRDVARLRQRLSIPLNLEMSMASQIVTVALRVKPHQVTLVPERRQELTTEGGLDVIRYTRQLKRVIAAFQAKNIQVSLFVDPLDAQIQAAADVGTRVIELHTGRYASVFTNAQQTRQLQILQRAAVRGRRLGLGVAAGHGLDYTNVRALLRIEEIEEVNIGFSMVSRALFVGLAQAVRDMKALLQR